MLGKGQEQGYGTNCQKLIRVSHTTFKHPNMSNHKYQRSSNMLIKLNIIIEAGLVILRHSKLDMTNKGTKIYI